MTQSIFSSQYIESLNFDFNIDSLSLIWSPLQPFLHKKCKYKPLLRDVKC